jgi:hypothetical protein
MLWLCAHWKYQRAWRGELAFHNQFLVIHGLERGEIKHVHPRFWSHTLAPSLGQP